MKRTAPIFLSASDRALALLRPHLAAHRELFPSHLPSDEPALVEACVSEAATRASPRCPVWLSDAAFDCMDRLLERFPAARFIRVGQHTTGGREGYLEVDADALEADPCSEARRVLSFIGMAG